MRSPTAVEHVIVLEIDSSPPHDIKVFSLDFQKVIWMAFDDFYTWGGVIVERLF